MTEQERNKLVMDNIAFAHYIVKKYYGNRWLWPIGDEQDAKQIAVLAMIHAAELFEEGKGAKYITFAGRSIFNFLNRELETGGVVTPKAGSGQKDRSQKVKKCFHSTRRLNYLSFQRPGHDNDSGDWIVDDYNDIQRIEDDEQRAADIRMVWRLLEKLKERDRYIIEQRFFHDRTLQELADEEGISKERIRQIEERVLRQMREQAEKIINVSPVERRRQVALKKWNELFPEEKAQ